MIFRDSHGIIVDETGDGGDSSRAHGIVTTFYQRPEELLIFQKNGVCFRHPYDVPWDSPNNYSRDQLMCFVSGLHKVNTAEANSVAKLIFKNHAKRLFFCQNIERDYVGSRKYPWPHTFINDRGEKETRAFDFADPMLPHHVVHLIFCARIKSLYFLAIIGWPLLALSIIFGSKDLAAEQNQIQCMVKVAGRWAVWLYKKCNPVWEIQTKMYWESRDQKEIADMIIRSL